VNRTIRIKPYEIRSDVRKLGNSTGAFMAPMQLLSSVSGEIKPFTWLAGSNAFLWVLVGSGGPNNVRQMPGVNVYIPAHAHEPASFGGFHEAKANEHAISCKCWGEEREIEQGSQEGFAVHNARKDTETKQS
jgi:hypothetical protein